MNVRSWVTAAILPLSLMIPSGKSVAQAGTPPGSMVIQTIPSGVSYFVYSSNTVLSRGVTPAKEALTPFSVDRICFEKDGYETFWKTTHGQSFIEVTLRPLAGPEARPSSRCFSSGSQIVGDRKAEEEAAARIAKKKRDDELYWKKIEEAKAAKAQASRAGDRNSQGRTPVVGPDGTLLIPSGDGYIVPQTGEYVPPGGTYRSPRPVVGSDGTVYTPSGAHGYINTRTGQYIPVP